MILFALVLVSCGGQPLASGSPSSSPSAVACTAGGAASADWPAPSARATTTLPIVAASVSGDVFTLTFDRGTPAYEATPQSSAHFTETNGRGAPVDLKGSAGVLIVLSGFRGDMQNYVGRQDFASNGPTLLEVREIGDFEGRIGWAAGLSSAGCVNVTAAGPTLTFHFIKSAG